MEQRIFGWRFAAERVRRRRGIRGVQLPPSAQMIVKVCRMLGARTRAVRAPARGRPSAAEAARTAARVSREMPARVSERMSERMSGRMTSPMAMPARIAERVPTTMTPNARRVAGGIGLLAAGVGVARWAAGRSGAARDRTPKNRWIMVTVNCSPQRLASRAALPAPITRLGDAVDIKIAPAPGDRGTELGARLRDLPRTKIVGMVARRAEEDPRRMVEQALRDAKAIIETGEVLRPDWPAMAQPAQGGELLEMAGRRGGRP